jgi:S-formylglutathione hydrolase
VNATTALWKENYNMYDYIVKELPGVIEHNLPVTSKRSIFGHSMGGHGALICYLKNPGMYTSCSAFAPICNPINCPWGEKALSGYLGDNKEDWKQYDASELLASYTGAKTPILVDQGAADNFYEQKQLLPESLAEPSKQSGVPVEVRMQDGYDHSYYFISSFVDDHVDFHAKHLSESE